MKKFVNDPKDFVPEMLKGIALVRTPGGFGFAPMQKDKVMGPDEFHALPEAKQMRIQGALQISNQVGLPDWVEVDEKKLTGVMRSLPERDDVLPDINESLVVELYSK